VIGRTFAAGLAAGAAGTTALNAVTYADMALRGRPASEMPQKAMELLTSRLGVGIPGDGDARQHRLEGLGALSGIGTGLAVGAAVGLLKPVLRRLPLGISAVTIGAAAMAGSDVPMAGLGLTDPRTWSTADWLSDLLPHLAYGIATGWTLRALGGS
jgi:hypothetical protein